MLSVVAELGGKDLPAGKKLAIQAGRRAIRTGAYSTKGCRKLVLPLPGLQNVCFDCASKIPPLSSILGGEAGPLPRISSEDNVFSIFSSMRRDCENIEYSGQRRTRRRR